MKIQWSQVYKLAVIFLLGAVVLVLLSPFTFPLALGGVFSVIVFPIYKKLLKLKLHKSVASIITLLLFSLVFLAPTGTLIYKGASASAKFFVDTIHSDKATENLSTKQQENIEKLDNITQKVTDKTGLEIPSAQELINKTVGLISGFVITGFRDFFSKIPDMVVAFLIALITMYFCLVDNDKLKKLVINKSQLRRDNAENLIRHIINACRSVVLANVVTGAVQATLVALGAHFANLGNFFVVGFITFVMSFIPMIGSAPISLTLAAYGILSGHTGAGIAMVIVAGVAGVVDNIIRPILLSGSAEMHPLLGLLAILGGVVIFGFSGLIIGPLLVAVALNCIPIYVEDYNENR